MDPRRQAWSHGLYEGQVQVFLGISRQHDLTSPRQAQFCCCPLGDLLLGLTATEGEKDERSRSDNAFPLRIPYDSFCEDGRLLWRSGA